MFLYGQWQHCLRGRVDWAGCGWLFREGDAHYWNTCEFRGKQVWVCCCCFSLFLPLSKCIHKSQFSLALHPPILFPNITRRTTRGLVPRSRIRILSTARGWSSQCLGFKDLLCRSNQRDRDRERKSECEHHQQGPYLVFLAWNASTRHTHTHTHFRGVVQRFREGTISSYISPSPKSRVWWTLNF